MRTINTRELQKSTRTVRLRLMAGEPLAWMSGKRVVAYLHPSAPPSRPEPWPDLMARLKRIHSGASASGSSASDLIYADRG